MVYIYKIHKNAQWYSFKVRSLSIHSFYVEAQTKGIYKKSEAVPLETTTSWTLGWSMTTVISRLLSASEYKQHPLKKTFVHIHRPHLCRGFLKGLIYTLQWCYLILNLHTNKKRQQLVCISLLSFCHFKDCKSQISSMSSHKIKCAFFQLLFVFCFFCSILKKVHFVTLKFILAKQWPSHLVSVADAENNTQLCVCMHVVSV